MVKNLHISIFILTFVAEIVGGHVPMKGGFSTSPFSINKVGVIKKVDIMAKKKPLAQVLKEFKDVHGDRYIYTEVNETNYRGSKYHIPVICKIHGEFPISVGNHLIGQGCPRCAAIQRRISNTGKVGKRKDFVCGVGVNDYDGTVKCNGAHIPSYHTWGQMLKRCYNEDYLQNHHTYKGCSVCEEWLHFSNFKKWFDENYVEGYCLDKDILIKGNKVYSPDSCCFVPNEINVLLCKSNKARGKIPIGVYERKMVNGYKYVAYVNNGIKKHFHLGTFDTPEQAFAAYKEAKEKHIQEMATQYFNDGKITEKVYNALMNYRVEITD